MVERRFDVAYERSKMKKRTKNTDEWLGLSHKSSIFLYVRGVRKKYAEEKNAKKNTVL